MTTTELSAHAVAKFLQENPGFFEAHADVFATLAVPHPHQGRTVSLGERQILTLRERTRELEWRLAELVHQANRNETIGDHLKHWCQRMLAESDPLRLPGEIAIGLAEQFDLQEAALRVWSLRAMTEEGYGAPVSDEVRAFADTLKVPYCGSDTDFEAVSWLAAKPASLAMVALRPAADAPAFGLLVLGSDDPERFTPDMGTAFLENVGQLASAALRRLDPA